ncbi:MAG: hypothetical protein HY313_09525 [Acidobacteria bacterium]|nr:hypothetical protein [Acidobacteriota bacterium]
MMKLSRKLTAFYCKFKVNIEFPKAEDNDLNIGHILFSRAGRELARICDPGHKTEFRDYIIDKWRSEGYKVEFEEAQEHNPFRGRESHGSLP